MKISDPGLRKDRSGATQEGREVYVGNLDWRVKDEELREFFKSFGTIENVRIPRNVGGKSKGVGFVTFSDKVRPHFSLPCGLYKIKTNCPNCSD